MSSGSSIARRPYTALKLAEAAFRQAGVPGAMVTAEALEIAQDCFNRMLDEFLNLGIQLWGRDRVILPLYLNQGQVATPLGTSVIVDIQQRTLMRPEPIMKLSDAGGIVDYAFDGDLSTGCQQTVINGTISALYTYPQTMTQIGVNFTNAGEAAYFIEYSLDNITWKAIEALSVIVSAGEWVWSEIEGAPPAIAWRIRSMGAAPLGVNELYFGNQPQDIPLPPFTYDSWDALPNKRDPGTPLQWFQDRQLAAPVLFVWPVPDATAIFKTLVGRRRRYLNQINGWGDSLDLSQRWYEATTSSLARRLVKEVPGADLNRMNMLLSEEATAVQLATGEERDPAPTRYNPGLEVYNF